MPALAARAAAAEVVCSLPRRWPLALAVDGVLGGRRSGGIAGRETQWGLVSLLVTAAATTVMHSDAEG